MRELRPSKSWKTSECKPGVGGEDLVLGWPSRQWQQCLDAAKSTCFSPYLRTLRDMDQISLWFSRWSAVFMQLTLCNDHNTEDWRYSPQQVNIYSWTWVNMVHWTNIQCIWAPNNRLYVAKTKSPEADAGWDSQSQTHGKPPCRGLVEIEPCVLSSFGNMKIADQPLHFVS